MDWADVIKYIEVINIHDENRQKEKIGDFIILLSIIHAEKPGQLLNSLQNMLEPGTELEDEIGDIKKLKALKGNKKGVRLNGN